MSTKRSHLLGLSLFALVLSGCASGAGAGAGPTQPTMDMRPLSATDFQPDTDLYLCRGVNITNAPSTNDDRQILTYQPMVQINGQVWLAVSPVNGACLTSGFGRRGTRMHRGLDLQSRPAGMVHAAGDGVILEAGYRSDFGNYVLIDHGEGIFTRYAHLAGLQRNIRQGRTIRYGTQLGLMGNSADYDLPVHLHYELLLGDYNTPERSFGLQAANILSLVVR